MEGEYTRSTTEPWTMALLEALIVALGSTRILETGTSLGLSTLWLSHAAEKTHGYVVSVDADEEAYKRASETLEDRMNVSLYTSEALSFIQDWDGPPFDFAFLDDLHEKEHVMEEVRALVPKMAAWGVIAIHDAFNTPGLVEAFRGRALPLLTRRIHIGQGILLTTVVPYDLH